MLLLSTLNRFVVVAAKGLIELVFSALDGALGSSSGANNQVEHESCKVVAVVGGSFAGLSAIRTILASERAQRTRVILIDQRDWFEYVPGILRLFCDPNYAYRVIRKRVIDKNIEFLKGRVESVEGRTLRYSDGNETRTLKFDSCILAHGVDYGNPITPHGTAATEFTARLNQIGDEAQSVEDAQTFLVLGAGAVGVELAAEIKCHYPEKKVTLVDAKGILTNFPKQTAQYASKWLKENGVCVRVGCLLDSFDSKGCTTKTAKLYAQTKFLSALE